MRGARLSEERVILVYASVELDRSNKAARKICEVNDQVKKSIRRMPWHWEPKKDVISCEKLR